MRDRGCDTHPSSFFILHGDCDSTGEPPPSAPMSEDQAFQERKPPALTGTISLREDTETMTDDANVRSGPEHSLRWKIDECSSYFGRMRLRGWCFLNEAQIKRVGAKFARAADVAWFSSYGQPSPDVAAAVSRHALNVRFDEWVPLPDGHRGQDFVLRIETDTGRTFDTSSVLDNARAGDPAHACWSEFLHLLEASPAGHVLEIGSRARSGLTVRSDIPRKHAYTGLDILPGPNVDVVGDAHEASTLFPANHFTAIFARSVFEHLAMPWKAVLELNRMLQPGGHAFIMTHQTWVLHEEPWDFWRYSKHSWPSLFNAATGFEIVAAAHGEPARIHAMWDSGIVYDMASHPAFLSSAVIARKTSDTSLTWPIRLSLVANGGYPPGELPTRG